MLRFTVPEELAGERLDQALSALLPGRTRAGLQKLIADGRVLADGQKAAKSFKVQPGCEIQLDEPDPEPLGLEPEDIPLDIVYEDEHLLVVNKPRGMVVHPAPGNYSGTLVNALLWHCKGSLSGINGVIRPGIVHRIDKDTSGLLIVAKTDAAHQGLAAQIKAHSFERHYEAVVHGRVKEDGVVRGYLARHPKERKRMAAVAADAPGAKEAVTHYEVIAQYDGFTHLRCRLETGRTHQIRVQLASVGHPVAGDPLYGPKKGVSSLGGQCLHAKSIAFTHPVTGERLAFDVPLPPYFTAFLQKLRGPKPFEGLLLAVDCDGTLLNKKKKISPGNEAAIKRFMALGGAFTLATGRSIPTAASYMQQLNITEPVILYNGAMIYDPVKQEPIWSAMLPEHIKELPERAMAQFPGLGVEILSGKGLYAVGWNSLVDVHLNGSYRVPHERCGVCSLMDRPWIKVLFVTGEAQMPALIEWLHSLNLDGVEMTHSDQILYEVLPKEAGKGRGLERLAALAKRPLSQVAAMGDYYNDLSLAQAAAVCAAPANACPEMKAAADYVTPSDNDGDAVAEFIEYLEYGGTRGTGVTKSTGVRAF